MTAADCEAGSAVAGGAVTLPAGGSSCGGDVTLSGAAGRVTAADCEADSAVAGAAATSRFPARPEDDRGGLRGRFRERPAVFRFSRA